MGKKRHVEHDGRTQSVRGWARELGLNSVTILRRLNAGKTLQDLLDEGKARRHWSPEEDAILKAMWGLKSVGAISRELDRDPESVQERGNRLSLDAGKYGWSLKEFAQRTGYSIPRIKAVSFRIRVPIPRRQTSDLRRKTNRPRYLVTPEVAAALLEELKAFPDGCRYRVRRQGEWGRGRWRCRDCFRTTIPHAAKGKCKTCYKRTVTLINKRNRETQAQQR